MKRFQDLTRDEKDKITSLIEYNVSEEALARRDYYHLLELMPFEHQYEIKDIINDEINHSIILMKLAELYSQNKPSEFESLSNLKKKG